MNFVIVQAPLSVLIQVNYGAMGDRILGVCCGLNCHHVGGDYAGKQENKATEILFEKKPLAHFPVSTHICIFLSKIKTIFPMLFYDLLLHLETLPKYFLRPLHFLLRIILSS